MRFQSEKRRFKISLAQCGRGLACSLRGAKEISPKERAIFFLKLPNVRPYI